MKLIVGLGNPGKKFENTRHNIGFIIVDEIAKKLNVVTYKEKYRSYFAEIMINGEKVILAKPLTYMNLSGEAVKKIIDFYDIDLNDVLIIHDDLDLPVGKIRLREKGSSGGHNGLKSIEANLKSKEYKRLKFGIDKDSFIPVKDYVIGKFKKEDLEEVSAQVLVARDAAIDFLSTDFKVVMTKYN